MDFDTAFHKLLGHEGGYVDHPDDPGGETNWGITVRVARLNGYTGPMRDLPVETAKAIYRKDFWMTTRCEELPAALRYPVFDAAVNSGVRQAVIWLQRAAGVDGMGADGVFGPRTMLAVKQQTPEALVRRMLGQRLRFMTDLKTWSAFGRGWARRIADLLGD
jgi:lysozyme family protein